ncbi:Biotin ECF transporter S component BioY2 [uncultured Clostridium sp.]|uniref:biotin transporter BioY n=1 Tax=uncultured Clostridium sp. TaxID=59620 RepID=UPI0008226151|nr:biotin transporter BioY [uncultured Clostridium sp.]SCJ97492.1 Biotin ECF transporter S component BioY2 [uncultured Clostridium sp.]
MINVVEKNKVRDITAIGLMVALLCISSYIAFPLPFTPIMITSQTIIINLIALTMNTKNGVLSIIVFYLIGAIGLPVFSGGRSGVGTLIGPSGGYFLGFLLTVLVISLIKGKNLNFKKSIILTMFVGMIIIYVCGAAWMGYYNGLSFMENLKVSILPFIPGDLIKCVLASFIAVRINKIYGVGNE